jgi:hypothetical protein
MIYKYICICQLCKKEFKVETDKASFGIFQEAEEKCQIVDSKKFVHSCNDHQYGIGVIIGIELKKSPDLSQKDKE